LLGENLLCYVEWWFCNSNLMFFFRLELPELCDGVHFTGLLILSLSLISLQSLKVRSTKECKDLTAKYSLESKI